MKDEKERLQFHPSSFILHPFGWRYTFCCTFPVLQRVPFGKRLRTVGVSHHRVLWSPDFPLPRAAATGTEVPPLPLPGNDRPAGLQTFLIIADNARLRGVRVDGDGPGRRISLRNL